MIACVLAWAWGCSSPDPPADGSAAAGTTDDEAVCFACFWEHQPSEFREELLAFYRAYATDDPLVRADIRYLLGRVTEDHEEVCRSVDDLESLLIDLTDARRRRVVLEMIAFAAEDCDRDPTPWFWLAADAARDLGEHRKARLYASIASARFRPEFADGEIPRSLEVAEGARAFELGRSAIRVRPGDVVAPQIERTLRDWLSYQMRHDFAEREHGVDELLGYHEGARIRDVLKHVDAHVHPVTSTVVAWRDGQWFAPDELGVFRFEVLPDKVQYPTTRVHGDLALLVDTHGIASLVAGALDREADLVVGCGDSIGKAQAASHLARLGIDVYFPCDRFVGELIGYVGDGVLIGSGPVRSDRGVAIIGDRPIRFSIDETIVVQDTARTGRFQYYDAAARYFRRLSELAPVRFDVVEVDGSGQSDRVIARAGATGATAIALRVETDADYEPVRDWLAASADHRAVLFHSAPYPAGVRLFDEFPEQTTFGDPRPRFE
ncbi:MAG: hypothetical protein VKI81_10470 [Synechococcaceae cyanobacterium]|nr:hypothetical protein [Synechococcaceae cyanobacterium]